MSEPTRNVRADSENQDRLIRSEPTYKVLSRRKFICKQLLVNQGKDADFRALNLHYARGALLKVRVCSHGYVSSLKKAWRHVISASFVTKHICISTWDWCKVFMCLYVAVLSVCVSTEDTRTPQCLAVS
jgi:hypothetical protein